VKDNYDVFLYYSGCLHVSAFCLLRAACDLWKMRITSDSIETTHL